jgi:hypothetical protein
MKENTYRGAVITNPRGSKPRISRMVIRAIRKGLIEKSFFSLSFFEESERWYFCTASMNNLTVTGTEITNISRGKKDSCNNPFLIGGERFRAELT